MVFQYGDIAYVDLDPSVGHEQCKRRPVVVVSSNRFNAMCNMTFVAPITSTNNGYPLHVPVRDVCLPDGSHLNGFIAVEQVKSLDLAARFATSVGCMPDDVMERVTDVLLSCLLRDDLIVLSGK